MRVNIIKHTQSIIYEIYTPHNTYSVLSSINHQLWPNSSVKDSPMLSSDFFLVISFSNVTVSKNLWIFNTVTNVVAFHLQLIKFNQVHLAIFHLPFLKLMSNWYKSNKLLITVNKLIWELCLVTIIVEFKVVNLF